MWLLVGSAVLLALLDLANFAPIDKIRASALAVGRPVSSVLGGISRPVSATWNAIVHYDDIEQENAALRHRIAELEGQSIAQVASSEELQAVLESSDISYVGNLEAVSARVVTDRVTASSRIVELDKGSNHGLRKRMPVVTEAGLVGHIGIVSDNRSTVQLLTSDDVAVGIRNNRGLALTAGAQRTSAQGPDEVEVRDRTQVAAPSLNSDPKQQPDSYDLVDGHKRTAPKLSDAETNSFKGRVPLAVELSPELQQKYVEGDLRDNALFVTSGLNNSNYPSGIPVGYLQTTTGKPTIYSAADLSNLNYLTVLLTEADS